MTSGAQVFPYLLDHAGLCFCQVLVYDTLCTVRSDMLMNYHLLLQNQYSNCLIVSLGFARMTLRIWSDVTQILGQLYHQKQNEVLHYD